MVVVDEVGALGALSYRTKNEKNEREKQGRSAQARIALFIPSLLLPSSFDDEEAHILTNSRPSQNEQNGHILAVESGRFVSGCGGRNGEIGSGDRSAR